MSKLKATKAFAMNVKMLRIKKGLTMDELGRLLGVSRQRVNTMEKGEKFTSPATLAKIAQIFKIEETDLFDPALEKRIDR
jgi:putative transcriptional regulator